jgi:hypothetical protein
MTDKKDNKNTGKCIDLSINPNAEKYYLFLNKKYRYSTDLMDMDLPSSLKELMSKDGFWDSMDGKIVKEQVIHGMCESLKAVHVGCKNTLIFGFCCNDFINDIINHEQLKKILSGKEITEVIITDDVEEFALSDKLDAYEPCKMNSAGKESIWKYNVPYKNGKPCIFDEDEDVDLMAKMFAKMTRVKMVEQENPQ